MNTAKLKSRLIPYAFALVAAGIGFLLRIAITHFVGSGLPIYVTFYPFIMFVAVWGGLGPGLLTTVTSTLIVDYWFLPPLGVFTFLNLADAVGMVLFFGMGVLMSVIVELYRQRQAEQAKALRLANAYNRSLLESSLDPLVTISHEGKITDVNEAAVKVRGIPREKLIGTDFSSYFTEPEKARQGYQEVFSKGFVSDYPLTIRHKDGKLTDVLYNATVYKDIRGNVLGVFAAARDVTKLNDLEDKLIRSEKLAIVGKLASSVAHELRNPLGVIKNVIYYLNMLELGKDNPDIKENLEIISNEIENSEKVINDLLEFSRIKQPALRPEEINLIIKEVLNRVRVPANIKVVTELAEFLPKIQVDALQIQQVFYNLASNAIQAMEKGGTLTVSSCLTRERETSPQGDETIAIAFKDTGCGIPKENLEKIFEPLFSTKAKGTGLGLSVVASLVESNGGKIEIESEVGKGSIFTVKLPMR